MSFILHLSLQEMSSRFVAKMNQLEMRINNLEQNKYPFNEKRMDCLKQQL